jgi:hypothetical protein
MILVNNFLPTSTIVVTGPQFSGTSMVAGTLRLLGVDMGSKFTHADTHQDFEMSCRHSVSQRIQYIRTRPPTWGFKSVDLFLDFDEIYPHLVNPVLIYCSRSLADILDDENLKYAQTQEQLIKWHHQSERYWSNFLLENSLPTLLLGYDYSPHRALQEICEFLDLEPNDAALMFNDKEKSYQIL